VEKTVVPKDDYFSRGARHLHRSERGISQPVSWRVALITILALSLGLWWVISAVVSSWVSASL
jgi:hypothetical protein